MLQLEHTLDNLIGRPLCLNLHACLIICDHCLLLGEVTHTAENQILTHARNLHLLTQHVHVATDLLEIRRLHVNDACEIQARDADVLHIGIEQLQEEIRHLTLLRVLHTDTQLVRVVRGQIQRQAIAVAHRLDELE